MSPRRMPEPRQLVDRRPPEDASHARCAGRPSPPRSGTHALGPDDHRAELEHLEVLAVLADTGLPVEHRPAILELRRERREADERAR
jgi:hypothetical protein